MATRTRDNTSGKDKKPTTRPSTAATTKRLQNSNSVRPTGSPVAEPSSSKQQGKKPVLDTANKTTIARRRSFDKPVAPSNPQGSRASLSPTIRSSSFSGRSAQRRGSMSPTLQSSLLPGRSAQPQGSLSPIPRSSSFTGRSAQKASGPDRNSKAPGEVGKQQASNNRTVNTAKTSTMGVKKQEARRGSSKTKGRARITPREKVEGHDDVHAEVAIKSENQEPSSIDPAEQKSSEIGKSDDKEAADELALEDQDESRVEDQKPVDDQQTEEETGRDGDEEAQIETIESSITSESAKDAETVAVKSPEASEPSDADDKTATPEPSTVLDHPKNDVPTDKTPTVSEQQHSSPNAKTHEPEDKSYMEDPSSKQENLNEQTINEPDNIKPNKTSKVADEKEKTDKTMASNKDEEAAAGVEDREHEETIVKEEVAKTEEADKPAPRTQAVNQKKDTWALSNDHIEETASKLQEQRRNRVRALASAFESVISRQESM